MTSRPLGSTPRDTGGSAFPGYSKQLEWHEEGMTLRDWFAGKALANCQANHPKDKARQCYETADAMLLERAK